MVGTLVYHRPGAGAAARRVLEGLSARGVGAAVNYRSIHTLTYYKERFGYARDAFPVAADIGERTISLPLYTQLADKDVDRVVAALDETLSAVG